MSGWDNLKGYGFHERTAGEQREIASSGGKKSGEVRRKKADFRKTLNTLLTVNIDHPEWTPALESMGLDSTPEAAINAAMILRAMDGSIEAYKAIRDTIGQTTKAEADLEEQKIKIAKIKAETERLRKPGSEQAEEPKAEAVKEMDLSVLSEEELECLERIMGKL